MGVYTNCEEAELWVNGKSLGRQKSTPFIRLEWKAIYKPGKIEVRGYNGGKLVAREITETTGKPTQLSLKSDVGTLKADGVDVAIINIAIKDAKGRVVPTADDRVEFLIEDPEKSLVQVMEIPVVMILRKRIGVKRSMAIVRYWCNRTKLLVRFV